MIEKKVTITYNLPEAEDIEKVISELVGRKVKLEEMDVILTDYVQMNCMGCEVYVDDEWVIDEDDDSEAPLDKFLPEGVNVSTENIFAFDTSLFKSFEREMSLED